MKSAFPKNKTFINSLSNTVLYKVPGDPCRLSTWAKISLQMETLECDTRVIPICYCITSLFIWKVKTEKWFLLRGASPQMPNHRQHILVHVLYGVVIVYFHVCISPFILTKIYHSICDWDSKVSLPFLELKRRYPPRLGRTTPRMAYLMQSLGYCNSFHMENIIYRHGHLQTNLESVDLASSICWGCLKSVRMASFDLWHGESLYPTNVEHPWLNKCLQYPTQKHPAVFSLISNWQKPFHFAIRS